MLKKTLAILFAAVAVFTVSACSKDKKTDEKTNENVQTEITEIEDAVLEDAEEVVELTYEDYTKDLSTERYDGYNFRILIRPGKTGDQYLEEDSSDRVQSAVYRRNKTVEEMYGITITAAESSNSDYETDALNSILAGDDAYDIVFTHSRAAFTYAVNDAVVNINDIETIDLDKPWWAQDVKNSCELNGRIFILDGDISMHRLSFCYCLFFNKRIFDELGFDYPYEMVREGEWTFDEFAYLARKGGKDLSGDGIISPDVDQIGYYVRSHQTPSALLYTAGQKIYDKNDEGELELTLYSNKTVSLFDDYFMLTNNDAVYMAGGSNTYNDPYGAFRDGRVMFWDASLGDAQSMRNMEDEFGIVPIPKYTEEDDYGTTYNGHAHLAVIPVTVSDKNRTGAIVEALCAIGSRDVLPEFYDVSLKTKYSRDDDSQEMLDIIKDSIVYDLGYVGYGSFASVGSDLAKLPSHDFASYYAERETAAQKSVKNFYEDYAGLK